MRSSLFGLVAVAGFAASASADIVLPSSMLRVESVFQVGVPAGGGHRVVDPNASYSNVTAFTGTTVQPAGAALQGTNGITRMLMDDINVLPGAIGQQMTTIRFAISNVDTAPVSARPRFRLWNADGGGGPPQNPGNYYAASVNGGPVGDVGFSFNPITFPAGSVTVFTFDLVAGLAQFAINAATIWAGFTFDNNNGTTGATLANLNNLGMGVFDPVDVGTSADTVFLTTGVGSFFGTDNPAGAQGNLGGVPPANLGFEFVVPAPGAMALLGLGGLLAARRRR